jgi:1-hydroxycarotenoid 3,4-desaturase
VADVVVIGAGIGGLSAAITLAGAGLAVEVWEAGDAPGGKAATVRVDGVDLDTGPSVLTLPDALDEVFAQVGRRLVDEVRLLEPTPAFRYRWPDGTVLDLHPSAEATLASVRATLGATAAGELERFLAYARRIWTIAAPRFVLGRPPTVLDLFQWEALVGVLSLDPFRTMGSAIDRVVRDPRLRDVLRRYATYNGSDPRRAPATLNCIAHVELGLGGFGVEGGIGALVRALHGAATGAGVRFRFGTPARRVEVGAGGVVGVAGDHGFTLASAVVVNADVGHLLAALLPPGVSTGLTSPARTPSTSGWTGVWRTRRDPGAAHTVLFPSDYAAEFVDLFDRLDVPPDPTVYACAPARCHARTGWADGDPLFTMVNAPAGWDGDGAAVAARVAQKLRGAGLLEEDAPLVWSRTPAELAARFPHTGGALYGAASHGMTAAFRRPPNRVRAVPGLYLASGSAHPGGGLPLCARSGLEAGRALLADGRVRRAVSMAVPALLGVSS